MEDYIKRGWAIFPLKGKLPARGIRWRDESAPKAEGFREGDNVGLDCGKSGLIVIDIDSKADRDGIAEWNALTSKYGIDISGALQAKTGGGGYHFIFKDTTNGEIGNSAGKLGPGIDVRANGGYIVLPPSVHPQTGAKYEQVGSWEGQEPAPVPPVLVGLLRKDKAKQQLLAPAGVSRKPQVIGEIEYTGRDRYAEVAIRNEVERVRSAPSGERNDTLNRAAHALGRLVGAGRLNESDALSQLRSAAGSNGLSANEINATIASGFESGKSDPEYTGRPDAIIVDEAGQRDWEAELIDIINTCVVVNAGKDAEYKKADPNRGTKLRKLFSEWILHEGKYISIPYRNDYKILRYDGKKYCEGGKEHIEAFLRETLVRNHGDEFCKPNFYADILKNLKIDTYCKTDELNPIKLIPFENGVLDPTNRVLMKHSPDLKFTYTTGYNYDPTAECPRWESHIAAHVLQEQQAALQEMAGYMFMDNNRYQKWFLLRGPGQNGKSIVLDTLRRLIGEEAGAGVELKRLANNDFAVSRLYQKKVNICADISATETIDVSRIKTLTGDRRLDVDVKHEDGIDMECYTTLIFSTNICPKLSDRSDGCFRRVVLFDFIKKVENIDSQFQAKIDKELPGIFNWAMVGFDRLRANGKFTWTEDIAKVRDDYERKSDPVAMFCDEYLEEIEVPGGEEFTNMNSAPHTAVYDWYCQFCANVNIQPLSRGALVRKMYRHYRDCGHYVKKYGPVWKGLKLKTILMKHENNNIGEREYSL